MNDWPPPSVDDAPTPASDAPDGASAPATSAAWWQRPLARGLLLAWVIGGVVALAVVLTATARGADPELVDSVPTAGEPGPTSAPTTAGTAATNSGTDSAPPTSEPEVRSAPPVPPAATPKLPTVPPATTETIVTSATTIVVTLPATTAVPTLPARADPRIEITTRFDAAGDDTANPNDEWVRFTNAGTQLVDMTDWLVRDDGLMHAHVFEPLILGPGAAVTLYSGCGEPTPSERFFCIVGAEVWNNDGDIVSLFDDRGRLIAQRSG